MSISGNYSNPYSSYSSSLGSGSSSSISGNAGASDINFSNGYQPVSASTQTQSAGGEQKSGGIGGFFKGIFNGAKNAVKSLFTPKGLLMAGAGIAACVAFPVAAPLVLGGLAVAAGGSKMYSSMKNGDSEGAGEGFFTAGTGALGAWGSGALGAAKAGSAGSGAAEASSTSGGFLSKLNPLNWFKSKPASTTEEPPVSLPSSPSVPNQQNPNGSLGTGNPSGATTEVTTQTEASAANAAPKPKMFQGARDNFSGAYNYIKTPFTGPMPEGATAPGMFARTGQVLTGRAPGVDVGKPLWTLPSTTALSGGLPQPGQEAQ